MWSTYDIDSVLGLTLWPRMQSTFVNGSCLLEKSKSSQEILNIRYKIGFYIQKKKKAVNNGVGSPLSYYQFIAFCPKDNEDITILSPPLTKSAQSPSCTRLTFIITESTVFIRKVLG